MKIDVAISGGGIKGYALLGAIQELEEKGFSFEQFAATSSGAILASLYSAGYKSEEIQRMFTTVDVSKFLDSRKTCSLIPFSKWLFLYWKMGLYQGNYLEVWLEQMLKRRGVYTFKDLPKNKLRIIAADITNGKLLVLPDDLHQYGIEKETFPVARAVRMSCSLPYVFEPVKLKSLGETALIVDGGILSNFPIWLFVDKNGKKKRPVIGLKLTAKADDLPARKIKNSIQLFESLFTAMKNAHDAKYVSRKLEKQIVFIPTNHLSTTDFSITDERKNALIELGRYHTKEFLKTWSY